MSEDLADYLDGYGLKVRYLHSDIDALERVEILRGLRLGTFDVLIGVNLLREGLDLPEVSLVAIMGRRQGRLPSIRSVADSDRRACSKEREEQDPNVLRQGHGVHAADDG